MYVLITIVVISVVQKEKISISRSPNFRWEIIIEVDTYNNFL